MNHTEKEARFIAADIIRLAKTADPDGYQFGTELSRAEENDIADAIAADLMANDPGAVFGWLSELALADTTSEQDRESAEDLQFRILLWIAAAPPKYPDPVTVSAPAFSWADLDALEDRCLDMGDTDID